MDDDTAQLQGLVGGKVVHHSAAQALQLSLLEKWHHVQNTTFFSYLKGPWGHYWVSSKIT